MALPPQDEGPTCPPLIGMVNRPEQCTPHLVLLLSPAITLFPNFNHSPRASFPLVLQITLLSPLVLTAVDTVPNFLQMDSFSPKF